ncbi:MAG: hypothetical protein GY759_15740 [Chloroflexi bacterium]|nr:hypothetical protein [Chloroflexota bacterium]
MVKVSGSNAYLANIRTRMPFRYGIAELTETPHLFCEIDLLVNGNHSRGISADSLIPKWFTKDPQQSYQDEIGAMLEVIGMAMEHARQAGDAADVFSLWRNIFETQKAWASQTPHPPLLWNFGVSLVERAMIDAYCRAVQTPFCGAVADDLLGIDLGWIYDELQGRTPAQLLPEMPTQHMNVRHTVGLSDPLAESELPPQERLQDGLPQTLEAGIEAYGLRYFKIKVNGDDEHDLARLTRIAQIIETSLPDYAFTLDGNEQYTTVEIFQTFWHRLMAEPELAGFMQHLLYVEQPFSRAVALSDDTGTALQAWQDRPTMIIDESDAELHSLRRALACGYAGTSHKNCKGVFKGLANACILAQYRERDPKHPYIVSGEDLATIGPVALLQDLAVMATLGLTHVERNGHHYFPGLSIFPQDWQEKTVAAHPDLYHQNSRGLTCLRIEQGAISLQSVVQAPFGLNSDIDLRMAIPLETWQIDNVT